jgi:hypothetical protein
MSKKALPGAFLLFVGSVPSFGQELSLERVPLELRSKYEASTETIEELVSEIRDLNASPASRVEAFSLVQTRFPYVGIDLARQFALDESEQLQLTAVRILASSVVMMNHGGHENEVMHSEYVQTMDILRDVIERGFPSSRELAASVGASLNDPGALDKIVSASASGVILDGEALKYLTLSDPEVGEKYVSQYLASESIADQERVISYLGILPQYRAKIRDQYLLSAEIPESLQSTAARVLARTDPEFNQYFSEYANTFGVAPEVLRSAVKGAAENSLAPLTSTEAVTYENLIKGLSPLELNGFSEELEILDEFMLR